MDELLEFFEELDEMVYVSDMESYDLIYMNRKLRDSLNLSCIEDYRGKKCYEILQGCSGPCRFCTNSALKEHKFVSWVHNNPVLKKRFLIKDSVIMLNDKQYRIEIAIDVNEEEKYGESYYYTRSETLLNECLKCFFSAADPEDALNMVLQYIGKTFSCDRVYIFEFGEEATDNTYEWCADGVEPQKDILQKVPLESIDWWIDLFENNELVTIRDMESIRTEHPSAYSILKPQKIDRLVVGSIIMEKRISGLIGVDNPKEDMMSMLTYLIKVIGYFVSSLLKRRDLLAHLQQLSFRDALTGAYNRNALYEHSGEFNKAKTLGIIYCDITGLKQINDLFGHIEGDRTIQQCYEVLKKGLNQGRIYRTGGDEFLAVFQNFGREEFAAEFYKLRQDIHKSCYHIASGFVWTDQPTENLDTLISQADKMMYEDKRAYHEQRNAISISVKDAMKNSGRKEISGPFYQFLNSTYHDMEFFFRSIAQDNTEGYFYFGDMQKDLFFISDNMRDEFGFESNTVPGLLYEWADRILSVKAKKIYWNAIEEMVKEKRKIHDLRYWVRKSDGSTIWIRCYGLLKWNEDESEPLFIAGRITHQDDELLVDSVTNFPKETAMFKCLEEAKANGRKVFVIGFCFNNISELNSTRGRAYCDHLIHSIAEELTEQLTDKMSFYRLEGMRCAAIVDPECEDAGERMIEKVRDVISKGYQIRGIALQNPCSFVLSDYPKGQLAPSDFLEELVTLLRIVRHDSTQPYLTYSDVSIRRVRHVANQVLALSQDVLNGMENFRIVIQPIVSAGNGRIIGGEALLRWRFEGKDLSPSIFIPVLEKENMIQKVGRWVFEQAVCTCMRILSYNPDFYLSFNVSLQQMADKEFMDFMKTTLKKYRLDGCHLVAEMTESCMDEQPEQLVRFVDMCRKVGIRIALDDFGSGYSSLRMLLQYPTNIIKLDKSMLGEMMDSLDKRNFISSIVYACHQFGKTVCMEGVETEEQDSLINEAGCDMIQGYYYYRPMEIREIYRILAKNNTMNAEYSRQTGLGESKGAGVK